MDCQWFRDNPAGAESGGPGAEDTDAIQKHISECPECRLFSERMEKVWGMLDVWDAPEPPPRLGSEIVEAARREKLSGIMRRALSAAAVFLLVVGIMVYAALHRQRAQTTVAESPSVAPPGVQQVKMEVRDVSEEEIIRDLHILQQKEFLDSMDTLKMIDYIPLIEEPQGKYEQGGQIRGFSFI